MRDDFRVQLDLTPPSQEQMRRLVVDLSDEERHLLLDHGEEAPFCGVSLGDERPALYSCRLCGRGDDQSPSLRDALEWLNTFVVFSLGRAFYRT